MTSCDQDAEIDETLASDLALETAEGPAPMGDLRVWQVTHFSLLLLNGEMPSTETCPFMIKIGVSY